MLQTMHFPSSTFHVSLSCTPPSVCCKLSNEKGQATKLYVFPFTRGTFISNPLKCIISSIQPQNLIFPHRIVMLNIHLNLSSMIKLKDNNKKHLVPISSSFENSQTYTKTKFKVQAQERWGSLSFSLEKTG